MKVRPLRDSPDPGICDLLSIAFDALKICPPDYVRSILGPYHTWLPPHDRYSEFTMLDLWRLRRAIHYLVDISTPSVAAAPPHILDTLLPPVLKELFFVQSDVCHRPDYYDDYTSYPHEKWFFINGILTNGDVAQLNAAYLSYLFHRPVTLIQNGTNGWLADLWECALAKEWYSYPSNTEPARIAFPALYDALTDPNKKRVVVVCHSQGTIITAVLLWALKWIDRSTPAPAPLFAERMAAPAPPVHVVLDDLDIEPGDFEPLRPEEWDKLEIYCFATCANWMVRVPCGTGGKLVPWIEHFGNENDLVARLGMLAPNLEGRGINIDGPRYQADGAWGHLLNIDYLLPIEQAQKSGHKRGGAPRPPNGPTAPFRLLDTDRYDKTKPPRLFSYINGGTP